MLRIPQGMKRACLGLPSCVMSCDLGPLDRLRGKFSHPWGQDHLPNDHLTIRGKPPDLSGPALSPTQ